MISVIVCSETGDSYHKKHVDATIGVDHEYIMVDNTEDQFPSLCAAYNEGVSRAQGDICLFVHEDVFMIGENWGYPIETLFEDETIGLVGVVGTQYLFGPEKATSYWWGLAGHPYLQGWVVMHRDNFPNFTDEQLPPGEFLLLRIWEKPAVVDVVAADGLFFAIRSELFDGVNTCLLPHRDPIRFDDKTFDGWHFYDLDISMQVRQTHRLVVTPDVLTMHCSNPLTGDIWEDYGKRFVEKWKDQLPASSVGDITPPQAGNLHKVGLFSLPIKVM